MNFGVVTIVGTGLIGGSIGLALKERDLAASVIGVGRRKASINKALKLKAIDEGTVKIEEAVEQADIIILATSVDLIPGFAKEIIPLMKRSAILTDVGSTKDYIVSLVNNEIGNSINRSKPDFIGAHPLAGSEQSGIESARSDLFEGSVCIMTPTSLNSKKNVTKLTNMWNALGAKISVMTPLEHDEVVAFVSHLPHFVASNLTNVIKEKYWEFGASGLRDTTRVASGNPELWLSISKQNKLKIIEALRSFAEEVRCTLEDLEQDDNTRVLNTLKKAKTIRDKKQWKQG